MTKPAAIGSPQKLSLRTDEAFGRIHRKGRWVRADDVSLGVDRNQEGTTRIGIRTRRGLKGAVNRNRLRRQVRTILYGKEFDLQQGIDLLVVIHPRSLPIASACLEDELKSLCKRASILRS